MTPEGYLRESIFYVGAPYIAERSTVVDLGCGEGLSLAPFIDACDETVKFVGVDRSESALKIASVRFASYGDRLRLQMLDLAKSHPSAPASLTLSIFTLHHMRLSDRARILCNVYAKMTPGGAFILAERVKVPEAYKDGVAAMQCSLHADMTRGIAATHAPTVEPEWYEKVFAIAGFNHYLRFFQFGDIAAWVLTRD